MIEFTLDTDINNVRSIIRMHYLKMLYDPGAGVPVFDLSPNVLKEKFGGEKIGTAISHGIGGKKESEVYRIKEFDFGLIKYKDIPVIVTQTNDISADVLLGATMFGAGVIRIENSLKHTIKFQYPDRIAEMGKLWTVIRGEWKILDFIDDKWVYKDFDNSIF